jgi:nardilysin
MSDSDAASAMDDVVLLGPDLDKTRSKSDKKLYRHVTLKNGLKCVLICDTAAMRQRKSLMGRRRDESEEDGGEEDESEDDNDDDDDDDDDDDHDGLRKAATALLVNVGSYHDPPYLQGLSHFLEHMLFLGTEDYPEENAYDKFLSSHGGDDNAYTGGLCSLVLNFALSPR